MQWFLYFLYYVQSAQYYWPTTLQRPHIQVHELWYLRWDDNNYWCSTNTIARNWSCDMCVCLALIIMNATASIGLLWHFGYNIYYSEPDYHLWTDWYYLVLIDTTYFTLGTGSFEFKCYERSYGILDKPLLLYYTLCNTIHDKYTYERMDIPFKSLYSTIWLLLKILV